MLFMFPLFYRHEPSKMFMKLFFIEIEMNTINAFCGEPIYDSIKPKKIVSDFRRNLITIL